MACIFLSIKTLFTEFEFEFELDLWKDGEVRIHDNYQQQ